MLGIINSENVNLENIINNSNYKLFNLKEFCIEL